MKKGNTKNNNFWKNITFPDGTKKLMEFVSEEEANEYQAEQLLEYKKEVVEELLED